MFLEQQPDSGRLIAPWPGWQGSSRSGASPTNGNRDQRAEPPPGPTVRQSATSTAIGPSFFRFCWILREIRAGLRYEHLYRSLASIPHRETAMKYARSLWLVLLLAPIASAQTNDK